MNTLYEIEELMAQTRRLAAIYKKATQQTLPVTHELSRYDAQRLLLLAPAEASLKGVDYLGTQSPLQNKLLQIKGRVIFSDTDENSRVAELNQDGEWQTLILVLFNEDYEPSHILAIERSDLVAHFGHKKAKWPLRLGLCKKLGQVLYGEAQHV